MDFFSKLGKKASETYQITKEKAATLTEELKLKSKMNDAKENINQLYNEIGKKVYDEIKLGNDVIAEEIMKNVDKISELKDKIEKTEIEILALKKIKKCINCGAELKIDDGFCSECGTRQIKSSPIEEVTEEQKVSDIQKAEVIEVKDVENNEQIESTQEKLETYNLNNNEQNIQENNEGNNE